MIFSKKNEFIKKIFLFITNYFFLILSLILFFYIFFRSEITWNGEQHSYYLKYYFVNLILFIFSIIIFFLNRSTRINLLIVFSSLVFGLYLFEISITIYSSINLQKINPDGNSRYSEYIKHKDRNEEVVLTIYPSNFLNEDGILPLSGISNKTTIDCNENGYFSKFKSDRYGFNNPNAEWDKDIIEFLILGDSFAQGQCVNRPYDIGSNLRKLTDKNKGVLNLGYSNTGPLFQFATMIEFFKNNKKNKIKNILWLYFEGNDLSDLNYELQNKILVNYLNKINFSQKIMFNQDLVDTKLNNFFEEKLRELQDKHGVDKDRIKNFLKIIKLFNIRTFTIEYFFPQRPKDELKLILSKAKKIIEANNTNLFFVYVPHYSRYNKLGVYSGNYEEVQKIVSDLKIPIIDLHEKLFKPHPNPLSLVPTHGGHFIPLGYELISQEILKTVYKK